MRKGRVIWWGYPATKTFALVLYMPLARKRQIEELPKLDDILSAMTSIQSSQ